MGTVQDAAPLLILSIPFFLDAIFSLGAIYQAYALDASKNLRQDLLAGKEQEVEQKFLPMLLDQAEKYLYANTDNQFMPVFLNESYKTNAFNLGGAHVVTQMVAGIVSFVELYFAILAAVHSSIAPFFSVLVAIHAVCGIYSFFGIPTHRFVLIGQSSWAALQLACVALGYLYGSYVSGFHFEISFVAMTILLAFDAFLGFALISVRPEFSKNTKSLKFMDSFKMAFYFDNWKQCQLKSNNAGLKNFAFILTTFESVFACAAFFTLGGF